MLVVTTENVPGYRVRDVKGQVIGVVVRSHARRHAVDRMVKNAALMQANAIIMMQFHSAEINGESAQGK